jgi:hypothetical protein
VQNTWVLDGLCLSYLEFFCAICNNIRGASCLQQSVLQSVSQQERDLAHEICAPVAMHGDLMIPAHFTHHPLRVPSPDKINLRLSASEWERERDSLPACDAYTRRFWRELCYYLNYFRDARRPLIFILHIINNSLFIAHSIQQSHYRSNSLL